MTWSNNRYCFSKSIYKNQITQIKKSLIYILPIYFDNKRLEFIHPNCILHENDIIIWLPESLQEDEIPSTIHCLSNTIRNKIFNYKNTVKNINTNDARTYGTGIISYNCTNSKYLNHHHEHIITGDTRIIRGGSRAAATSKMERCMILVNGF